MAKPVYIYIPINYNMNYYLLVVTNNNLSVAWLLAYTLISERFVRIEE